MRGQHIYQKPGNDLPRHGGVQRIELLGPIELDRSDTVEGVEEDIIRVVARLFLGDLRES